MDHLVAFLVALAAAGLSYVTLYKEAADKIKLFAQADPEDEFTSKNFSRAAVLAMAAAVALAAYASALQIQSRISHPLGVAKMVTALLCMVGAGCFDLREKRIPNIFPGAMAALAVVYLVLGLILGVEGALGYITSSVVAAVACAIFFVIAAFLTRQGIGAGDIKLIIALALLGGVYVVMGTLFFGVLCCCVAAVVALLSKKKTLKQSLPFGPFLLMGYVAMLFVIQY